MRWPLFVANDAVLRVRRNHKRALVKPTGPSEDLRRPRDIARVSLRAHRQIGTATPCVRVFTITGMFGARLPGTCLPCPRLSFTLIAPADGISKAQADLIGLVDFQAQSKRTCRTWCPEAER